MARTKSAVASGVWCPVVSIYNPDSEQEIDLEASKIYFSHLIRGGIHGLVLQGSTAEAVLLSPEERVILIRTARDAASELGVPDFPVAAGVSGQSTRESLKLVDEAANAGADFGLLLPPRCITNDAILDFYEEVADHSKIPIIVYNVCIPISNI
jgi:dihydrodipicolinate synthase/N-acetylneuraminate lyase